MKTIPQKNALKLVPESIDDLWLLTKIVDEGDEVSGSSTRRVKALDLTRNNSGEKKKVFVVLRAENIDFAEHSARLRITGVLLGGSPSEFIQVGEHHTLDVGVGDAFNLSKALNAYQKDLLRKASKIKAKALLVVMDDRGALVAHYSVRGTRVKCELSSSASKRDPKAFDSLRKKFFEELTRALSGSETIVLGGPGFAKEDYYKWLKDFDSSTVKRVRLATASTAERSGLTELVKNGAVEKAIGDAVAVNQSEALTEFLKRLATNGLACYGIEDVQQAMSLGAVDSLLLSDELLKKSSKFSVEANKLLEQALATNAKAIVFSSNSDAGKEFESFAVAALLRYRIK